MSYDRMLAQKEQQRKEALASQDALQYLHLCTELGMVPEDSHLYEQGEALLSSQKAGSLERKVHAVSSVAPQGPNYTGFLREAEGLRPRDFSRYTGDKRVLLQKYFPGQFDQGGKQDISRYDDAKLGALFYRMVGESEKYSRKQ